MNDNIVVSNSSISFYMACRFLLICLVMLFTLESVIAVSRCFKLASSISYPSVSTFSVSKVIYIIRTRTHLGHVTFNKT